MPASSTRELPLRALGGAAATFGGAAMSYGFTRYMDRGSELLPIGLVCALGAMFMAKANARWLVLGLVTLPVMFTVSNLGWFTQRCVQQSTDIGVTSVTCLGYSNPIPWAVLALAMMLIVIWWKAMGRALRHALPPV